MLRFIFYIILILLITGLEKTNIAGKLFLNPTLCFIIFFAVVKEKFSFLWPILGGIILDFYSIFKFPLFTLSLTITFVIIKFFAEKIITFKNIVSLMIFSIGGILFYNIIFFLLNGLSYLLGFEDISVSLNKKYFFHILANIIFTFLLFIIFRKKNGKSILHS